MNMKWCDMKNINKLKYTIQQNAVFQNKGFTFETLCLLTCFKCTTYVLKQSEFC